MLLREQESVIAKLGRGGVGRRHATAIGTGSLPNETLPSDGVAGRRHTCALVRPPTVIEHGRLIAGRHPSAWGPENAWIEVRNLVDAGVTLFVDLTHEGELEPYSALVQEPFRYVNRSIRDFSIPSREQLIEILDEIDAELAAGGIVYVHCWAGCGRTGVVVGAWLVRHGVNPQDALRRIADARGLGCPQTLEQRTFVLDWREGL